MESLWVSLGQGVDEELVNLNMVKEIYVSDYDIVLIYGTDLDFNKFKYNSKDEAKYYLNEIKKMLNIINIKPYNADTTIAVNKSIATI